MNLIAGAADLPRKRFTLWGALGEAVWVALYVGLGYAFAGRLDALIPIVVDWSGLVLALGLGLGAAVLLVQRVRRRYPVEGQVAPQQVIWVGLAVQHEIGVAGDRETICRIKGLRGAGSCNLP